MQFAKRHEGRMNWLFHALMFIGPSVAFAWIYVSVFDRTNMGASIHLLIVVGFLVVVLAFHGMLSGNRSRQIYRGFASFWAFVWVLLIAFYFGCFLSLSSWGRIPDATLIWSYVGSLGPLLRSQGLNPLASTFGLLFTALALFCMAYWMFARLHWNPQSLLPFSRATFGILAVGSAGILGLKLHTHLSGVGQTTDEPFQIVFGKNLRGFRNIDIDEAHFARISAREQTERQSLQVPERIEQPNVVLIIAEGVRPDHLSAFGYSRQTMPRLTEFAKNANEVTIHQAWSVCGESFCGILGLLASRYYQDLPARPITFTEVMKRGGYEVHYVLSGDHSNFFALRELYGPMTSFHDGSTVDDPSGQIDRNDDRHMLGALEQMRFSDSRPSVLVIHVMGGHLLANRFRAPTWTPDRRYGLSGSTALGDKKVRSPQVVNFYDNGLLQADEVIGDALEILDRRSLLDNALVVVTSDHGESLGEHGVFGHAKAAYEHALRVPLIAMRFGAEFRRDWNERALISLIDVAPSVLCEIGFRLPEVFQGVPLQADEEVSHIRFSQGLSRGWIRADADGAMTKFWSGPGGRNARLHSLDTDPGEEVNLANALTEREIQALISTPVDASVGTCPRRSSQ